MRRRWQRGGGHSVSGGGGGNAAVGIRRRWERGSGHSVSGGSWPPLSPDGSGATDPPFPQTLFPDGVGATGRPCPRRRRAIFQYAYTRNSNIIVGFAKGATLCMRPNCITIITLLVLLKGEPQNNNPKSKPRVTKQRTKEVKGKVSERGRISIGKKNMERAQQGANTQLGFLFQSCRLGFTCEFNIRTYDSPIWPTTDTS